MLVTWRILLSADSNIFFHNSRKVESKVNNFPNEQCLFFFILILVVGINSSGANPFSTIVYRLFSIQRTIFYSFHRRKQAPIASQK